MHILEYAFSWLFAKQSYDTIEQNLSLNLTFGSHFGQKSIITQKQERVRLYYICSKCQSEVYWKPGFKKNGDSNT